MTPRKVLINEIEEILSGYGFTYREIRKDIRDRTAVLARNHAIHHVWSTRYDPKRMSLVKIGMIFNRDHTSVRHALGSHMTRIGVTHPLADEYTAKTLKARKTDRIRHEDFTGRRFGRLIAIRRVKPRHWECVCDCGQEHITRGSRLKAGDTKSCGCMSRIPPHLRKVAA